MKKILFAALAALAITSCSQNEEIEARHKNGNTISKRSSRKSSRAAEAKLKTWNVFHTLRL